MLVISLNSCFKKDITVVLPPKTGSSIMQVRMGSTYEKCYFINLAKAQVVKEGSITDWDLRFDATPNGQAVLMNAGHKATRIIASNVTSMQEDVYVPPLNITWGFDAPNQLVDSAYVNNWWTNNTSNNRVYILRQGDGGAPIKYYKFKMLSVDANSYTMQYDTVNGVTPKTITISKNSNTNFVYFTFADGGNTCDWEPPKTTWDLCFMQYHQPFYTEVPFLYYPVTGVLTNSYQTQAAGDTTISNNFVNFTAADIGQYNFTTDVNAIGYNWKKPDENFNYVTYPNYLYLVKTQQGAIYKLHFLDFYYQGAEKGAPKFEFERLQ
jgi:hypothetical protein